MGDDNSGTVLLEVATKEKKGKEKEKKKDICEVETSPVDVTYDVSESNSASTDFIRL